MTSKLPLQGGTSVSILLNDETFDPNVRRTTAERSMVSSGYFDAIGIPFAARAGQYLKQQTMSPAEYGVVVNRALVELAWPGRRTRLASSSAATTTLLLGQRESWEWWKTYASGRSVTLGRRSTFHIRHPTLGERSSGRPHRGRPLGLAARPFAQSWREFDADLPLADVRTMSTLFERNDTAPALSDDARGPVHPHRGRSSRSSGIYGNMSYHVAQRTHEIGVRVALGADKRTLLAMVLKHALKLAAIGVAIGLVLTLNASFLAGNWAYGISFLNPLFLLGGTLFVLTVAVLAAGLPAMRAAKVDPIQALRSE